MENKTIKHSKQRDAIIDFLSCTTSHPDAEALYMEVKKSFPNISLATVYRNLKLLLDTHQIIKLSVGNGKDHFDACCKKHCHFVCDVCGEISDLAFSSFNQLEKEIEDKNNVLINSRSMIFYGTCEKCRKA